MATGDIVINLFLSLVFGGSIGLERQNSQGMEDFSAGGMRTYSLISLIGAFGGIMYANGIIVPAGALMAVFFSMVLIHYAVGAVKKGQLGMTTEASMILTFVMGATPMINVIPNQLTVAIFIGVILILSRKDETKKITEKITDKEIDSFVMYAIVAFIVLPFLPNVGYTINTIPGLADIVNGMNVHLGEFNDIEIINPQKLWFVAVLITGVDVVGYILSKCIGKKRSMALSGFLQGFASSTASTFNNARKSHERSAEALVGITLFANVASFFEVIIVVGGLNPKWLSALFPSLLAMIVSGFFLARHFIKKDKEEQEEGLPSEVKDFKIFSIESALKFATLVVVVKLASKVCYITFGQAGFVLSLIVASFSGMSSINVSLAAMAGESITFPFAVLTFLLVNGTNLIFKMALSYKYGTPKFAKGFTVSAGIIIILSFFGYIWL